MTDINKLLEPAIQQGLLRHATKFEGEYDDLPAGDYQDAMFKVAQAKSMFEQLPASIRAKHKNDPGKFLEWSQDPANSQEMLDMGILKGNDGFRPVDLKAPQGAKTPSGAAAPGDMDGDGNQDPHQSPNPNP